MGQSSSTARDPPDTIYPDYLAPHSIQRGHSARNEDMNNRPPVEQNGQAGSSSREGMSHSNGQETGSGEANDPTETWQQPTLYSGGSPHQMRSIEEEGNAEIEDDDDRAYRSAAIARMPRRDACRGPCTPPWTSLENPPPRSETGHSSGRFSPFSALGSRGVTRRRSTRGPYFIPSREDPSGTPDAPNNERRLPEPNRASWRRSARLNRVRHSISTPISHMFGQPHSDISPPHEYPPHLSADQHLNDLPQEMDTRLDWRESIGDPLPDMGGMEPPSLTAGLPASDQPNAGIMGMRRLPGLLRARSSRALRPQEQTPLSRVLQLAAAAIAAQLSGTTGPAMPNIQALGNDGIEGSLENFIQSLQHATSPQGQPSPVGGEGPSNPPSDRQTPPVNFLRVFRFANSDSATGSNPLGSSSENSENLRTPNEGISADEPPEGGEGRLVTLVVVGVRSVPSGNGANSEQGPPAPGGAGLDALLGLPFLPPSLPRPQDAQGDLGQGTEGQPRMHAPRPAGLAGVPPSRAPDFLRQAGLIPSRRMSDVGHQTANPAYPPISAVRKSSWTSSSTLHPCRTRLVCCFFRHFNPKPQAVSMQPPAGPSEDSVPLNAARQRRRSDSEFARHRALGSGGGRSWLIYVVGTNLSENHPALTTPSLFTDNPTYEDMILLSSLLGPAKPPVASQDDVNSAGGLFRLVEYGGSLVAESVDGTGVIQISDGERCLICLSDYEVAEEVRELNKCKHVFHRDCIDQWLTTGRNSCPLCRGQGVHETSNGDEPATSEQPPAFPGTAI
ncbi:hypothetical protein N7533_011995 [Penicillium manginii]|uniref:uncharacterized protein n=1 Tax=Penicillium manginii TaxID=203109 RepID=UPI002547D44A|nr:uncharacterized protein N7533_011995 [Penicillium manginii]KAJ5739211.1 hypothetical protein N7533_011995 [Penicillium manginii]